MVTHSTQRFGSQPAVRAINAPAGTQYTVIDFEKKNFVPTLKKKEFIPYVQWHLSFFESFDHVHPPAYTWSFNEPFDA